MTEPRVICKASSPVAVTPGGGVMTTIVHRDTVNSISCFAGIGEIDPGKSPHRWHNHIRDNSTELEIIYPEGFEEYYYILKGNGMVQWKLADGTVREEAVGEGDTVFFPVGVTEHQLLNTGETKIILFFGGGPPTKRIWK